MKYSEVYPNRNSIKMFSIKGKLICHAVNPYRSLASASLISVHSETMLVDVILRSPAYSGTTKNLEILRGACSERLDLSLPTGLAEGLRMTLGNFRMDTD